MEKKELFIISKVSVMNKIISCVVAFFVLLCSMNLLNFEEQKATILKSIGVSADTVISQFFYISTFPAEMISMLFIDTDEDDSVKKESTPLVVSTTEVESNQSTEENSVEDNNSSKASIGYSILSGMAVVSKVINSENMNVLDFFGKVKETNYIEYFKRIFLVSDRKVISVMFTIMLLLAILLARRNVGGNNIINNNKIKNKTLTQLI
jgi:hypothetical protein